MTEEHLEFLKQSGDYSKETALRAAHWLKQFQAFCRAHDKEPAELRTEDLEQWHKELSWTPGPKGKLYSQNSINQAVGAIRRLYRWSLAEGKLKADPSRTLVTPNVKNARCQKLEFTPSETRKLLSSPDLETPMGIRDRAILGILLETQASRKACSRIDVHHLCFDTGALLTKGRNQQIHSLSDGLNADLKRYLREARPLLLGDATQALFLNRFGNRISAPSVHQLFHHHRKLCGL